MKKIIILFAFICSCNMSDQEINLPEGYLFYKEGGYANAVLRNNKGIIEHSAIDYSYNDDYIMLSFDTLTKKPKKIEVKKIFFLVHYIKKDSLSKRLNYEQYKKFIKSKGVSADKDLSLRQYKF